MNAVKLFRDKNGVLSVERFPLWRRIEHVLAIGTFAILVVTGFPQKFYQNDWATAVIERLGGLAEVRTIHRIAGIVFTVMLTLHILAIVVGAIVFTAWHKMRPQRMAPI